MFMFRSRRSNLGRRLWKARVRSRHETGSKIKDWETLYRSGLLKEAQLELLVNAVETRDTSECVLLPRTGQVQEPHFLCCQLWRWPDLKSSTDLKAIPASCKNADNDMYICCNPYHWSRLCKPESPPPPYCRFSRERLKPEDRAPSEGNCCGGDTSQMELRGSLATNGEGEWCASEWCRLAYWELSRRVGRQYGVERPSVDVFWNEPRGDGLCLAALAMHSFSPQTGQGNSPPLHNTSYSSCSSSGGNNNGSPPPPDAVRRAREKIGRGVTLCLEPDGVWAYNRSESPIFVHSPSLDQELSADSSQLSGTGQSCLLVQRVPPGHCLNVFARQRPTPHCDCETSSPLMTSSTRFNHDCVTSSEQCNDCMTSSPNCMTSPTRCSNCVTSLQQCNDCMTSSPTCMTSPTRGENCMTSSTPCNNCTTSPTRCSNCMTSPTDCTTSPTRCNNCMTSQTSCNNCTTPPTSCSNNCMTSPAWRHRGGMTSSSPRTIITTPAGPVDPNSVRISFVKGWGPKYSRQEVTACPTWLEVLLAPCR